MEVAPASLVWECFSQLHRRRHEQSISASAVYIDLCFLTEKGKRSFARPHEFIKFTWK